MSDRDLEIWQLSDALVTGVHRMTLESVPKFEMFAEGSQIRRSMKSVKSNIVEGCGRCRYKQEFIRYLTYAHASCDETTDHLETLFKTGSLKDERLYNELRDRLIVLSRKLNKFLEAVASGHLSEK